MIDIQVSLLARVGIAPGPPFFTVRNKIASRLQKAYEQRSGSIRYLKMEPGLDNLRSDPWFVDLMRRVGLAS